jgi:hypothetical protein
METKFPSVFSLEAVRFLCDAVNSELFRKITRDFTHDDDAVEGQTTKNISQLSVQMEAFFLPSQH